METRFVWNVILVIVSALLQATSSQNATNSTTVKLEPLVNSSSLIITNLTSTEDVLSLTNSTDKSDASKKDKRQAQRGYTDIPLDERSFNDQLINSSPAPFQGFEPELPPLAEKSNNELTSSSNYLPNSVNPNANFSPRLGFPANLPNNVPAAAASNIERRDDFFDTNEDGKPIPGEAGRDYPTFSSIPRTSFSCKDQAWPGYFADTEARCQVFWICQKHRMDAFLCPNGTLFNQQVFVCDWWFNVDCNTSPEYYSRNQFLYSGPGVGIDGQPTRSRSRGLPATPGGDFVSANSFVNAVVPRPNPNANPANNGFINQVQSSNQVPRVASVGLNQISRQQSPPPPPSQPQPNFSNGNQQNGNYLASPSQQSQQQYSKPIQNNQNQNEQQFSTSSEKYASNQNMLANRMQKNPTNPTHRPQQSSSPSTENSFTGGYQQQQQHVQNQFNQAPSNDVTRRVFTNSDQNQNQLHVEYHTNRTVSTTRKPEIVSIQTSSRPLNFNDNNGPKLNVNVEPKGSNQQHPIITFSGTISSTARPLSANTEVPSYNHGSSTLQTPKDFGISTPLNNHQQQRQNNGVGGYQELSNNLNNHNLNGNGGYQNSNNQNHNNQNHNNGYQQGHNNGHLTTSAPITTTFRSTSTTYSTQMRVVPQNHQLQLQQLQQHQQPSPNPNNVSNRQFGSIGSIRPPSSTPSPNYQSPPPRNNGQGSVTDGFVPSQPTPSLVTSTLRPPSPPGPDLNDQRYIDRHGFVQNNQIQAPHQQFFVSSTTPQPLPAYGVPTEENTHLGQRANQYSNYNGQREIMYSPSSNNANVEYPYSPSQQKNKQRWLELESLKNFRTSAKEMFSYPHFHGQRSNAYSEPDRIPYGGEDNSLINVDNEQTTPQTRPYHDLPGENIHPSSFRVLHTTPQPQHQVSENHHSQQIYHHSTPGPSQQLHAGQIQHQQNFGTGTPTPRPQNHQNSQHFGTPTPHPNHQNNQHFASPTPHPQNHQNNQQFGTPTPHPNLQINQHYASPTPHPPNHQHRQNEHVINNHQNSQNNFAPNHQPQQNGNFHHPQTQQNVQSQPHPVFQHSSGSVNVPHHVHSENVNHINNNPRPTPTVHPNHQQFHKQVQPSPNFLQPQSQSQHVHLSPSPAPSTPFHQQIVKLPSQSLQLPSLEEEEHSRDGFTSLKSGSFISIATANTAAPPTFSKQILHNQKTGESPKLLRLTKSQKLHVFQSPTPPPNGLNYSPSPTHRPHRIHPQSSPQPSFVSTLRPPPAHSTPSPFTNEAFSPSLKASPSIISPTPFTNQNSFIAAPTESSVTSTSPGHRSNPYLPHNHGKRVKQSSSGRVITTTIKYPEGTSSLKVGVPGASNTKRLVDFSYSAFPKGTTKSSIRSSTFPTVKERFNGVISGGGASTTRRPQYSPSSSPSPHHKEHRRGRLAGAVVNKSTSSSTAIYVDSSVTAESVSTPVSVPIDTERVTPAPAVSTSNFGLKISTMAKKKMANAWQNYFGNGEKATNNSSNSQNDSPN